MVWEKGGQAAQGSTWQGSYDVRRDLSAIAESFGLGKLAKPGELRSLDPDSGQFCFGFVPSGLGLVPVHFKDFNFGGDEAGRSGGKGGGAKGGAGPPRGPKPKGTGPHNQTIQRRVDELRKALGPDWEHVGGGPLKEEYILTPSGTKGARRPDITFRNKNTGEYYRENVGKTDSGGAPVKREVKALDDIERATGKRPEFTPCDR